MGSFIPQVVTENTAASAHKIPYSLSFDSIRSTQLVRTTLRGSDSNASASFSVWVKRTKLISSGLDSILTIEDGTNQFRFTMTFHGDDLFVYDNTTSDGNAAQSDGKLRDTNAWYHIFFSRPAGGQGTLWINGVAQSKQCTNSNSQDLFHAIHSIGARDHTNDRFVDTFMSEFYVIDGQALQPTDFAYTDPLTNIWRPKKYTGTFGTMGYYLPFDGAAPIGKDQSGLGNDFIPENFGIGNFDISTGAKPILNTSSGCRAASGGVRTFHKTFVVTVQNDGGNKFFFDGVNNTGTTVPLYRGGVYTFDQSDATNGTGGTHPLRFATDTDANGSTEYTDGVTQTGTPGTAGAFTRITVPHDAPDTLHYYCTNHNGMGGPTANTTDANITDPFAWKCILAVPGYGDNGHKDVSHIINHTTTERTISKIGNTTDTINESNFYGGSIVNDGSSSMKCTNPASTLSNSTGPWTIEFWFNPESTAGTVYMFSASNMMNFFISGGCGFESDFSGSLWSGLSSTITTNKWQHFASTRDGNTIRFFKDGQLINTATASGVNGAETEWMWGANFNGQNSNGHFQDMRVYFGVVKYTDSFICPATVPDLVADSPSGSVHPTILTKPNTGSVSFDGTNDFLTWASSSDFAYGTGDFTWEAWIYADSFSSNRYLFDHGSNGGTISNGGSGAAQMLYFNSTIDSSGPLHATGFGTLDTGRWYHLAASRQSGTTRLYRDGQLTAEDADTHNYGSQALSVGRHGGGGHTFDGFISNVRFVKGTALYTSNFKVPTEPLTAVTNTSLLCCQSTESPSDGEVTPGTININGNAISSTFNPIDNDIDTMLGDAGGFATFSDIQANTGVALSDGGLRVQTSTAVWKTTQATVGMKTGKFYCEFGPYLWNDASNHCQPGIRAVNQPNTGEMGSISGSAFYHNSGSMTLNGTSGDPCDPWNDNQAHIVGVAFDADTREVWFSLDGTWQRDGDPANGRNARGALDLIGDGTYAFTLGTHGSSGLVKPAYANFGQRPFKYGPPRGFKAVSLPNVTVKDKVAYNPENYFKAVLYPGDSSNTTNRVVGFQPDFVWIKNRTDSGGNNVAANMLFDSMNGVQTYQITNTSTGNSTNINGLQEFTSNGFKPGSMTRTNETGGNYIAWCWKAGDNNTITYTVKVVSDSGNKYRFNDFGTSAVTLELQEGRTFIFDQSDASNGPHPLRFSTTSDGTHGGGSEFTTGVTVEGVPGNAGARTIITVPAGTATLHYYCTAHSGMGGQANTPERGTSNFDGTRQSNITTNTAAGFSIVSFNGTSGDTIGHGLSQRPQLIIDSDTGTAQNWRLFHYMMNGGTINDDVSDNLHLNTNHSYPPGVGSATRIDQVRDTFFRISGGTAGSARIAYCWHSVENFSKIGRYTGNGSTNGPFVNCGFLPSWVMVKRVTTGATSDWRIYDLTRHPENPIDVITYVNLPNEDTTTGHPIDFLSNGFKVRGDFNDINTDGVIYIFVAFADKPSMNLYGAQGTAR